MLGTGDGYVQEEVEPCTQEEVGGSLVDERHLRVVVVTQSCLSLCEPMDFSLSSSSVHGILQAEILEWVASAFSRGSSQPRDQTWVFGFADGFFTIWSWEAQVKLEPVNSHCWQHRDSGCRVWAAQVATVRQEKEKSGVPELGGE